MYIINITVLHTVNIKCIFIFLQANYTDATIAVEGKFYPVHKLVMSTCSEYFSEIFERTPCKSPVVVLKDVRSQDMDALLDYMYLGEVNVNQNDLASLLKTAECLRIKGLAVPDEDPTKARKNLPDDRRESPPPKRRRHEDSTSSSTSAHQSTRPVSPSAPSPSKATAGGQAQAPPVQHSSSGPPNSKSQDLDTSVEPPPMVKVEMEEADDPDDGYRRDNSFDGGKANDGDAGDFGTDVSKSEHDPETYGGGGSYAGPSLQQGVSVCLFLPGCLLIGFGISFDVLYSISSGVLKSIELSNNGLVWNICI